MEGANIQIRVYLMDAHSKKYIWGQVMEQPLLRSALAEEVSRSVLEALTVLKKVAAFLSALKLREDELNTYYLA